MATTFENKNETRPFLERYYEAHRSTKLARNIGELALALENGLERRFDVEVASGFSEALNGKVITEYSFGTENGKIVAEDGEPLEDMMLRSRRAAYELAATDPEMSFVADRFEAEIDELHMQQRMVGGREEHNTLIKISPMTMELSNRPDLLKQGYQRPDLKRSMMRISHWDGKKMHILTRSLDNSSLDLLSETATEAFDENYTDMSSLQMLKKDVMRTMSLDEARTLLDYASTAYDKHLYRETGRTSNQGAYAPEDVDLLRFVESHPDILANVKKEVGEFVLLCETYDEFDSRLTSCLYRHLALYEDLLSGGSYDVQAISDSASGAGNRAAEQGTVYSMCGDLIAANTPGLLGTQTSFESLRLADRQQVIDKLIADKRSGRCLTCGASGTVHGCGLCGRCNKIWCDEYKATGKGLDLDKVTKRAGVTLRAEKKAAKAENKAVKKAQKVLRQKPKPKSKHQRWEFYAKT